MRFVVLDVHSEPREVRAASADRIRARLFRRADDDVRSLRVRSAANGQAAVIAYGSAARSSSNAEYRALLGAECVRRRYTPAEFLWNELGGTILLVVETAAGDCSLTRAQYRTLRAGDAVLPWLERPARLSRLAPIAESPQRVVGVVGFADDGTRSISNQ